MKMLVVLIAVLLAFGAGVAVAGQGVHLVVNGQEIDAEVVIKDGRSYVPLRVIVDALGATVQWDGNKREITINSASSALANPTLTLPTPPSYYYISDCEPAIETKIDGDFDGWEGDTVFKLWNGQIWQQVDYDYEYHYAYMPDVLIFKTSSGCKMKVEGVDDMIKVERIK